MRYVIHSQALHLSAVCIQTVEFRVLLSEEDFVDFDIFPSITCSTLPHHSRPFDQNCVTCYQP